MQKYNDINISQIEYAIKQTEERNYGVLTSLEMAVKRFSPTFRKISGPPRARER